MLRLVDREETAPRPLAEVRSEVASELARRRDEEALRGYLDRLRAGARIRVSNASL